jgi:hypothetical protein
MTTYARVNFEQMAIALRMEVEQIAKHENLFEAAARCDRLDRRRPKRTAPSKLDEKLDWGAVIGVASGMLPMHP